MLCPDTYKGFVYQKKCAFLYLLREFAKGSELRQLRLEHPNGDDFDLVFDDRWCVHQTKDTVAAAMPTCLKKMWRRYSENIRPGAPNQARIELQFIFSKDHGSGNCFAAVRNHDLAHRELGDVFKALLSDDDVSALPDAEGWASFLGLLDLAVLPVTEVEDELTRHCRQTFFLLNPSDENLGAFIRSALQRLDEVMAGGRVVSAKDARQVLERWIMDNLHRLPPIRGQLAEQLRKYADELSPADDGMPSPSGSGMYE